MRSIATILIALSLVAVVPTPTLADERSEARTLYRSGMQLIEAGRYDEGIARLEDAYETLPHPRVLNSIARACALAGRLEDSIRYFERYLESGPSDEAQIRAILDQLRAELGSTSGAPTPTEEPRATPPATVTPTSDAERDALRETAEELEALARIMRSDHLAERARNLRTLADASPSVPESAQVATTTTTAEPTESAATEPPPPAVVVEPESQVEDLYEQSVEGASRSASSPLDAPASTTVITRQDIRLSGATSIAEVLRRAAGVSVSTPTPYQSSVGIRGFNRFLSPRVLMLVNGRTTYIDALGVPFWDFQSFSVEDIERIEIVRGPASAIYGANGFSGVVNVILRPVGGRTVNEVSLGAGNARVVRGHAAVAGRLGSVEYRVRTGYQQADRFAMPFSPDRVDRTFPTERPAQAYRETHGGLQLRAPLGRGATLLVEGGAAYLDRVNVYATATLIDFVGRHENAYASAQVVGDLGRIRVFANRDVTDLHMVGAPIDDNRFRNDVVDVEAELHRRFHFGVDHDVHTGLDYRFKDVDWNFTGPTTLVQHHIGLTFEDAMQAGEHVRMVASLRIDRHPLVDRPVFSPRAALVLRPTESRAIRLSAGTAFRTPSFMDAFLDAPVESSIAAVVGFARGSERANARVEPERIESFELGYLDQSTDTFSIDASVYYNRVQNLIALTGGTVPFTLADAAGDEPRAGFLPSLDRFGYGASILTNETGRYHVFGSEISIRSNPIRGFDAGLTYAFNATRLVEADGTKIWDRRTSQHLVNLSLQYRAPFGLDLASDLHFSSKEDWPEFVTTPSGAARSLLPIPAYYLWNARVAYHFSDDRFEVAFAVYNLTNSHRRQHPLGQPLDVRAIGTIGVRIGE